MTRSCSQVTICFCYYKKISATNPPNQRSCLVVQYMALSTLNSLVDNHHIKCSICLGTFKGPNLIMKCLHHFCDTCIKESIQRCGNACPACRARIISRRDLREDHLLGNIVSEQDVAIAALSFCVLRYCTCE